MEFSLLKKSTFLEFTCIHSGRYSHVSASLYGYNYTFHKIVRRKFVKHQFLLYSYFIYFNNYFRETRKEISIQESSFYLILNTKLLVILEYI